MSMTTRTSATKAMTIAIALACGAISLTASHHAQASEPAKVIVKLSDGSNGHMSLTMSPSIVKPGPVEFTVKNESRSTVHEFLFARWSNADDALPYDKKDQQVAENKINGLQGVEDLRPRETVTAQFNLDKGRYVVFCNEPGHYESGMRTEFVVGSRK